MISKWSSYNRSELICFLEGIIFLIGVTERRAYFIENIKKEIGFTDQDSQSNYYNQISKSSLESRMLYIKDFSELYKNKTKQYLLDLLSCDPESPITQIGLKKIINLTKIL